MIEGIALLCRPVRLLHNTLLAGTLLSTIAMIGSASAQSDYPSRPVQLIVPYGAGGIADVGMRILADQLTGRLKQQFVPAASSPRKPPRRLLPTVIPY